MTKNNNIYLIYALTEKYVTGYMRSHKCVSKQSSNIHF